MSQSSPYDGISFVAKRSSNIGERCAACDRFFNHDQLEAAINHHMREHGYRLLHVGTETITGDDDELIQTTVAVLGTANPP